MLPMSLRTTDSERHYGEMKAAGKLVALADEPSLKEWAYWRLIDNRFPYDTALKTHHMLLPIRVVPTRHELTPKEMRELDSIVSLLENLGEYDFIMENFPKRRSILAHYHLHLGAYHDKREDMRL